MKDKLNKRRDFFKKTIAVSAAALTPQKFKAMPGFDEYTNNGDGFTFCSRAIL